MATKKTTPTKWWWFLGAAVVVALSWAAGASTNDAYRNDQATAEARATLISATEEAAAAEARATLAGLQTAVAVLQTPAENEQATPVPTEATPTPSETTQAEDQADQAQDEEATQAEAAAQAAQAQCRNTDFFDQAVNPPGGVIDVVLVGGEPCAATWRSAGLIFESAVCPQGWVCTFSTMVGTQVFQGTNQIVQINGATWRPLASFCEVLPSEQHFGQSQTPPFGVSAGPGSPSCEPQ